jgi:16S rRNA G966 N2-methylase RsmD
MDKTRDELIALCKEKGVKGYSGKKKEELVKLLDEPSGQEQAPSSLRMVDLFAGTGAFSLAFSA